MTPPAVIAKITNAGVPKLPAYVVINDVSKAGFFFLNDIQDLLLGILEIKLQKVLNKFPLIKQSN